MKDNNNPLRLYSFYVLYILSFLFISRLALSIWFYQRVDAVEGWSSILLQGLRVDIATLSFLLLIPVIYSVFASHSSNRPSAGSRLIQVWLTLITIFFVFMELATPSFIQEYNIRPNRLFVEYLIYPKEVFGMLIKSRLPELINNTVLTLLSGYLVWKWTAKSIHSPNAIAKKWRPVVAFFVLLLLAIGGRSTLGHRPLNPSMVYFSNDPMVNSLTLNSFYSVLWSTRQLLNEESSNKLYGELPEQRIIEAARKFKGGNHNKFDNKEVPTYSRQSASYHGKPKNLVIILEESLGARFVGSLGGLPLTPNIDNLSKEGLYFTRLFATGTRSVRGIEAVITGFTPTPDRAVVKLDKSQKNFFTIAALLKRHAYHTEFFYGGEAHFDNMKSFFLGNGFDYITEQKDYLSAKFIGSWGASDEDLFNKAHQKFETLSAQNKPFFGFVFSSSNHDPFEYPDGRITPYDSEKFTRNNAIKYADWALGQYIKQAKTSNYWKDTVFLLIADHDARSQGVDLVPIKSFHIPALILGEGIPQKIDRRVVSQIDMPPTLLSLMGIDNDSPMLGSDLSKLDPDFKGRALLQNGQNFGYLTEENISILQPHKQSVSYQINWNDFSLSNPTITDNEQAKKILGIALWGKLSYEKQQYKIPKEIKIRIQ